jgi:hypothetical protein
MRDAGFTWYPEVEYPQETVEAIAKALAVQRSDKAEVARPDDLNASTYASLKDGEKDRFARLLVGESAKDLEEFNQTGLIPEGKDDSFGLGGCVGVARQRVGSIWDLKNTVGSEILEAEKDIKETQFGKVRDAYAACAADLGLNDVDDPADLDELLFQATSLDTRATEGSELDALVELTDRVSSGCQEIWATGSAEAEAHALSIVRDRHPELFDAQVKRYGNTLAEVSADRSFAAFLAQGR